MNDLLAGYPARIEIPVAWGEMDAFGHVNNTVYIRWMETGRIAYLHQAGLADFLSQSGVAPILAAISCRYKAPIVFPDTVTVATRVKEMGEDRFTVHHRIISHALQRVAAEGEGVVVCYDYAAGRKAPLPDIVRRTISATEGMQP